MARDDRSTLHHVVHAFTAAKAAVLAAYHAGRLDQRATTLRLMDLDRTRQRIEHPSDSLVKDEGPWKIQIHGPF